MAVKIKGEKIKKGSLNLPIIKNEQLGGNNKEEPDNDIGRNTSTCTVSRKPRAASDPEVVSKWL